MTYDEDLMLIKARDGVRELVLYDGIDKIINSHPELTVEQLMSLCMKESGGRANPQRVLDMIIENDFITGDRQITLSKGLTHPT